MPVDIEVRGRVAVLTLNRAEALNALSIGMLDEIGERLDAVEGDEAVGAVVVTGAGPKAFSAGADIGHMREASPIVARDFARRGHALFGRIEGFAKPVVAAVNGYALGGGCELALACDIRVMSDTARIGLPEVTLGIFPGWGGTQRLSRLCSPGFAKEMIFTGRHVSAQEALDSGLVNHVHPPEEMLDKAVELAQTIASRPAWALAQAKALANLAFGTDHQARLDREADLFAMAFATEDQREGMAAFFEKRPAEFKGR